MTNPSRLVLATSTGIVLSSIFFGANSALTYIAIPTILHPPPTPSQTSTSKPSPPSKPTTTPPPQPLTTPSHLATQWSHLFSLGFRSGPPLALTSALSFIYASLQPPSRLCNPTTRLLSPTTLLTPRNLLLAAATFNILIIPFTLIFVQRTNNELHRRAALAANSTTTTTTTTTTTNDTKDGAGSREDSTMATTGIESLSTPALISYWGKLNMRRACLHLIAVGLGITALVL